MHLPLVNLQAIIRARGLTQVSVAKRLRCHESLVSHHLQGRRNYAPYLERYADALGVPVSLIQPAEVADA
ncbi:MAG: helix-turn-helix domain-containing protein [Dehalococcoidia bacterium]